MTDDQEKIQMGKHEECEKNALWQHVIRDVVPIDRSDVLPRHILKEITRHDKPVSESDVSSSEAIQYEFSKPTLKHRCTSARDVDAQTERRLRQGKMPIEARIDLHGMTQNQAYDALMRFVQRCYSEQKRCILVITGKGGVRMSFGEGDEENLRGILRQKVPVWLNDKVMDKFVLKIHTAKPWDGGEGALYVLLRRLRED